MVFWSGSSSNNQQQPTPAPSGAPSLQMPNTDISPAQPAAVQINAYLSHPTFGPGTTRMPTSNPQSHLFETSFTSPYNQRVNYTLQVYLSPSFPVSPPSIVLVKPAIGRHRFLDENMQVKGTHCLLGWNTGRGGLRELLDEVALGFINVNVEEIGGAPIENAASGNSSNSIPSTPFLNSSSISSNDTTPAQQQQAPTVTPPIPSTFPDLQSLPITSLNRLQYDDISLQTYISSLPSVKTLNELLGELEKDNLDTSTLQMGRMKELEELEATLQVLDMQVNEKNTKFNVLKDKLNSMAVKPPEVKEIMKQIELDISNEETILDSTMSRFISPTTIGEELNSMNGSVEEYISKYLDERCKVHVKLGKVEWVRLNLLANGSNGNYGGGGGGGSNGGYVNNNNNSNYSNNNGGGGGRGGGGGAWM